MFLDDFPPEVFSPAVMAELANGITLSAPLGPRLEAVFRCSFADVDSQTYSYDVYWYINEQSVVARKIIAYSNISQTLLRPADWVGQYQMNMVVRICISTYIQNHFGKHYEGSFRPLQ